MELTHKQAVNRLKDINDELERLDAKPSGLTPEDETFWADLMKEAREVDDHRKTLERTADRERLRGMAGDKERVGSNGDIVIERGSEDNTDRDLPAGSRRSFKNPWDLSEIRGGLSPSEQASEIRSRALSAIEVMPATDDTRREAMTRTIERWDDRAGEISRLAIASSSETYVRAFGKLVGAQGNMAVLDHDEQAAVARAMSTTNTAGGFLIPFQLDPSIILTADGSFNQVREIARKVVATGDVWNGVSSAGVTGSWDAEAAEVSDDAPTLAQPSIPIFKPQIFVPTSMEAAMDAPSIAQEVATMIAFEKDRLESIAFVTGSGSGQPTGVITALGAGQKVATATADTFAIGDLYKLDESLPARYRFRASWLAHRAIYNDIRKFDTAGGAGLWVQLAGDVPPQLIGKGAYESEAMPSSPSGTSVLFLLFGDFSNYVIADRLGTTIEYVPMLFGASGRPTGQRGWFAYARVGADSVNDGAFRVLNGQ